MAAVPALAVGLLLTSCSGSDGAAAPTDSMRSNERSGASTSEPTEPETPGSVEWGTCVDQIAAMASLECGTLDVPVDPADADGATLELALARTASTGSPQERIGSLIMNPGGPGGSGIEFLAAASQTMPAEITDRFDLVSFDPRGVGASTPVSCIDDETKAAQLEGDLTPDDDAELRKAIEQQEEFLAACEQNSAELLEHMSTADVAADLDLVRAAVGDDELTYLGYSYGTAIGAIYATMFPERTRALVLDGSVSPDSTDEEELLAQAQGFEGTLAKFVAACDADDECPLGPDTAAAIESARAQLTETPVKVQQGSDTRALGVDQFDLALATALYDTTLWGTTARAIAELDDGGGSTLLSLVDQQTGRNPDGTFDNSTEARTMVSCADSPERPTVDDASAAAQRIREAAPTFGDALAWSTLGCIGWPRASNPVPTIDGAGAAPILVIGTVGDPATPYVWSEQMAAALESAVLLTYEGSGHTAFLRGGECIETAVVDYLVELELPEPGTRCPAQTDEVSFGGLRDQVVEQFVTSGLPEELAECVVDGIIDDIGESEFDQLVLGNDVGRLTKLVTAQSIACATSGMGGDVPSGGD